MEDPETGRPTNNWLLVIRIVLGILFLLPGACGGVALGTNIYEWLWKDTSGVTFDATYLAFTILVPVLFILLSVGLIYLLRRSGRGR